MSGLEGHIAPLISIGLCFTIFEFSTDKVSLTIVKHSKLAEKHIPPNCHSETVLYMVATAGMRTLPLKSQNDILSELRRRTPRITNFHFADNHVDVISGKEEGMFAWISANYVLGRLKVRNKLLLKISFIY